MRALLYSLSFCLFAAAAAITAAALALPDRTGAVAALPSSRPEDSSGEVNAMLQRIAEEQAASTDLVGDLRREISLLQEEVALREMTADLKEDDKQARLEEENRRLLEELQGAFESLREERTSLEEKESSARLAEERASRTALEELRLTVSELKDELAMESSRREAVVKEDGGAQVPAAINDRGTTTVTLPIVTEKKVSAEEGTVIVILGGGFFPPGQDLLTPELEAAVQRTLPAIVTSPDSAIVVEGHTDSMPLSSRLAGQVADNRTLSLMRAEAVADLLEKAGVDRNRISSVGYGGTRPIAPNDTAAGRSENRRVEIRLLPPGTGVESGGEG